MPPSMLAELYALLTPARVVTDPAELFVYESDGFTIAHARPLAVVFPADTAQTVAVIKTLARHNVPIIPRGSGTGLAGGCVAFNNGVIVSTARMNKILNIDVGNRVAHVQAGVLNTQLSNAVAAMPGGQNLHFAPDPSSQHASTVGGNAATNAGGIHTLKDFVSSNHVLGVEMVLADGTVLQTGAAAGTYEGSPFDLPGLICGSEGTLGIITSLWVRLAPRASDFRTIVSVFKSTEDACNLVSSVIAAGILPAAMEMMDGAMVKVIEDAYHFGFPPDAQALVLTEIEGIQDLLDAQMQQIVQLSQQNSAASIETSADPSRRTQLWQARKSAFGAIGRISRSYCTQDACVPRSMLARVLAQIHQIGLEHGLHIPNVFHAGDGNVHPIFLYDEANKDQVRNVLSAAREILQYCVEVGGTITGEHGVGVEKLSLMPSMFDAPTLSQFYAVKLAFDPEERINQGKLVPSPRFDMALPMT